MRNATARLRAVACLGMAIVTLLIITPAASAAPAAPAVPVAAAASAAPVPEAPAAPEVPSAGPTPVQTQVATAPRLSVPSRVIASARSHLGARYRFGSQGPRSFDCSGLVLRAFADAGLLQKLGGWGNRSGYAIYRYGRRHHLVSRTNGQPGDVVIWGGGGHVGIYLGNGLAISALVGGVRIHGIHAVTKRFTAFVHMGLTGARATSAGVTTRPAPHAAPERTRHTAVALRIRATASTAAATVGLLSRGASLRVLTTARDSRHRVWYRVTASGSTGWVAGWLTRT